MGKDVLVFLIVDAFLITCLIVFIVFIIFSKKSLDIEKRITRFSISSITDKETSIFDNIRERYKNIVYKLSEELLTINFMKKYSKRYEKYFDKTKDLEIKAMNVISNKIVVIIIALFLALLSDALRRRPGNILQVIVAILVGYFIPDMFLIIKEKRREKQIEDDLFKAVLIMSNAFKSGRSIMQAVKIVSEELDGPIAEEFEKVYIDLTYGLELDVVFERLSKRIKLEETKYMASSLVILNKTGGNVVQVFNSIEKSFFERKRLNDELKSVTAVSNFVFKILMAIPFIIFLMIYILNPTYFVPLYTTHMGRLISIIILVLYVLYIIIVKRIIKIRE